jgi:hypothetical protein
LRLDLIAGLANHTVLIRKDGSEVPIDDSGAPIQEPGGSTRGVVLIFRDFSERKAAEKKLIEANLALDAGVNPKSWTTDTGWIGPGTRWRSAANGSLSPIVRAGVITAAS